MTATMGIKNQNMGKGEHCVTPESVWSKTVYKLWILCSTSVRAQAEYGDNLNRGYSSESFEDKNKMNVCVYIHTYIHLELKFGIIYHAYLGVCTHMHIHTT